MNFFVLICLVSANIYAGVYSINPERTLTPLVDIFSSQNKQLDATKMEVRISNYNKSGEISGQSKYQMPTVQYVKARQQASAVFRMIPSASSVAARSDGMTYEGTAFHIGNNLVLTNQHVLSPDRTNTTECGGFELRGNNSSDVFACKKVHYCNATEDVCLIEMAPAKRCLNFMCSKKEFVELKNGPALRLKADPTFEPAQMNTIVMNCIGNTMAKGIHFSQGRGIQFRGDQIMFFAPLRTGNSGGPLIGEDGLVWGVVKLESGGEKVSGSAYNLAESSEKVISLMREQLSNDAVTLGKFNAAVSE
jgi:hypothetical protein